MTFAAVVGVTGLALAQSPVIFPSEYARAWGRGSSSALGSNTTRTQSVFAQPFAAGTLVHGVGLRPTASTTDRATFTADIEVQMSSTAAAPGALSSTFASNVGSDMVVSFPRQIVNIPAMPANRPTSMFARFPFQTPFVFGTNGNTNINFDLFVYGRGTGASWSSDRAFAATSGRVTTAGIGCGSATISSTSTGGTYVGGATVNITMANGPALSVGVLQPAIDMSEFAPGMPLPFSLSLIGGGAGCDILVNLAMSPIAASIDAAGAAAISLPIPPAVARVGTGWQWIYLNVSAPAPLKLETTANRAIWFGPEVVLPNAQYVYSLSSVTSATGTATVDSVLVVEFML